MRPAPGIFRPQANTAEQFGNARRFLSARHNAMQPQRLRNRLRHRHARIKAAERVLENNLHIPPARAQGGWRKAGKVFTRETHRTAIGFNQAQHHTPERGFPAAAFANNRQHLTFRNSQ